jgi:cytochrome c peroxidase
MVSGTWCLIVIGLAAGLACVAGEAPAKYRWDLPPGAPRPRVPADNPLTCAKAELGRYLFYDKRISINGTESCGSCHRQELAFTDARAASVGATGELHKRGAMTLVNVAYSKVFNWSNPTVKSLEQQALTPMFGTHPLELGVSQGGAKFLRLAMFDAVYRNLFPRAYPGEPLPFTIRNVIRAIASFERTIVSADSPYDRYHFGQDENAISAAAKRGELLYFLDGAGRCFRCHGGPTLGGADSIFHNTGLYNLNGLFSYPPPNIGIYEYTKNPADAGKFKAPSLRNIALTAPYMHDGSIASLAEVLEHYVAGGRTIRSGPNTGMGSRNAHKDELIHEFFLTPQNKLDLVAFLESLTDDRVIHDRRFSDPWVELAGALLTPGSNCH